MFDDFDIGPQLEDFYNEEDYIYYEEYVEE